MRPVWRKLLNEAAKIEHRCELLSSMRCDRCISEKMTLSFWDVLGQINVLHRRATFQVELPSLSSDQNGFRDALAVLALQSDEEHLVREQLPHWKLKALICGKFQRLVSQILIPDRLEDASLAAG